jgi:uncharacterized membrane protein
MTTKQMFMLVAIIILFSFGIGWYLYLFLSENIASHWGMSGEVNGYMPKFWGLFGVPFMMFFLSLLLFWLPKIDPLKANVATFQKSYNAIIAGIIVFLFYIHLLTIFWNIGYRFDMGRMIVPPLALLWYGLGITMPKMKQNWFMGVRTPWTLESVRVWDETHRFAGKLFRYSGIVAFFGLAFPPYAFWFIIIPILISAFGSVIYSYLLFKKYGKDNEKRIDNGE